MAEYPRVGPPGAPGPSSSPTFVFVQSVPATSWTIPHNLGMYPAVDIVDSLERIVFAGVEYVDSNTVQIDFGGATSGKAYLNT